MDTVNKQKTNDNNSKEHNTNIPNESNTAIIEYLETVKSEYNIERAKKESFESRSGIILTLIGAVVVFVLEMVNLNEIFSLFSSEMTFWIFLKIVSGLSVYGGFVFTIVNAFHTISTKQQANFEVKNIDEQLLKENRMNALARLIFTYKKIIIEHRELNESRAKSFKKSLYGCTISITALVFYFFIK